MSDSPRGERALISEIASRITDRGPISFAEFMSLALHHPELGYYARGPELIGRPGDFITSPEVSSAFGECIAAQVLEMDRLLGGRPLTLVELGGGAGRLAADLLSAIGPLAPRLTLVLVETSGKMVQAQRRLLEGHPGAASILWAGSVAEAAALSGGAIEGVVLSNEFFDALPVHRVVRKGGELREVHVGLFGEGEGPVFEEVLLPLRDPDLIDYARRYGVAFEEGTEAEIGLEATRHVREIARCLKRGFHIVVDYGDTAEALYSAARSRGTLLAYSRHRTNEELLERVGRQDMTAHVNFTALMEAARALGLDTAGLTSQERFLVSLGLAGRISSLAPSPRPADIRRRLAMLALIHPEGMGGTFSVLVQYKGVPPPELTGLRDPYASGLPAALEPRS